KYTGGQMGSRGSDGSKSAARSKGSARSKGAERSNPSNLCSTMKDLSPDDRPREKLSRHGVAALGDHQLVPLVIGPRSRQGGALSVANALLAAYGGIHGLARCAPDDMARVAGIGRARAAQIVAALELGRRTLARAGVARVRLRNARDAAEYLQPRFGSLP